MDKHAVIGIDLAKRSIQVCLVNTRSNKVIKNKAVNSNKLLQHVVHYRTGQKTDANYAMLVHDFSYSLMAFNTSILHEDASE